QKYATFWKEFGAVLKEGIAQDLPNQGALLPLLRFAGTHASDNDPSVSLGDYLARMKSGQERIYYVIAETLEAARASPAIERLKERGLEVLLLAERIDEWVMGQLETYEGKRFKDASRGDLELGALASDVDRKQHDAQLKESKGLLKRIKDALGERISEARLSERLRESPACLVLGEHDLPERMRRILAAAGRRAHAPRGSRGASAGAHRDPGNRGAGAATRQRLRRGLPPASAPRRDPGQQGRVHGGARARAAGGARHPLQFPRCRHERGQLRRGSR